MQTLNKEFQKSNRSYLNRKKFMETYVVGLVFAYKSRHTELWKLPPKITVSLPRFTPNQINIENIYEQFGFLSALSIKDDENGYNRTPLTVVLYTSNIPLIDEPKIIKDIITEHVVHNMLLSACCLNDDEIWTSW